MTSSKDVYGRAMRSFDNLPAGIDRDWSRIGSDNPIADMIFIVEVELDLVADGEVKHSTANVRTMRRFVSTYRPYANVVLERLKVAR